MKRLSCIAAALLGILPTGARAAAIADSSKPLVCAVVDLSSCTPGNGCQRETAAGMNAPELIVIDPQARQITGNRPDGEALSTHIDDIARHDNILVLQGFQNELSWTVTVIEASGQMSLAAVGDGLAFAVFGRCMPK